jgi:hypothetical protein
MNVIKNENVKKIKINNILISTGLLLLLFGLYVFTRNLLLTEDSMIYAVNITKGQLSDLFHPHHLLYNPLLKFFIILFVEPKSSIETLNFLQLLNIIITVSSVEVLYLILWNLKNNFIISILGSLFYGLSYGPWRYSSQIEVYGLSTLLMLILLLIVVKTGLEDLKISGYIFITVIIILILLSHQLNIFFIFAIILAVLTWRSWALLGKIKLVAIIGFIPLVIVGVVYFALNVILFNSSNIIDIWRFATMYAQTGWWGTFQIKNFIAIGFGFVQSILSLERFSARHYTFFDVAGLLIFLSIVLYLVILRFRNINALFKNILVGRILIIWVFFHSIFIWWWYPSNLEFWIQVLPAVIILFALLYSNSVKNKIVSKLFLLGIFFIVFLILWNFPVMLELKNMQNEYICSSQKLKEITNDKDLIITSGFGKQYSYLQYFLNAKVYSLHNIRQSDSNDFVTNRVLSKLDSVLNTTMSESGSIFVTEELYSLKFPTYRSLENFDKSVLKAYLSNFQWQSMTLCNIQFYRKL